MAGGRHVGPRSERRPRRLRRTHRNDGPLQSGRLPARRVVEAGARAWTHPRRITRRVHHLVDPKAGPSQPYEGRTIDAPVGLERTGDLAAGTISIADRAYGTRAICDDAAACGLGRPSASPRSQERVSLSRFAYRRRDPFEMFFDRIDICPVSRRAMIASLGSLPLPSRSQQPRRGHPGKTNTHNCLDWSGNVAGPNSSKRSIRSDPSPTRRFGRPATHHKEAV